jgi:hypothetical protein
MCNQNTECGFACKAKSALSVTCTPPDTVEVEAVTDPGLYQELKKYGPQLADVLQTVQILKGAEGAIAQRTLANFQKVGASGDLVQACITQGQTAASQAHATLLTIAAADPTVVKANPHP